VSTDGPLKINGMDLSSAMEATTMRVNMRLTFLSRSLCESDTWISDGQEGRGQGLVQLPDKDKNCFNCASY
jgi:hypothetical protein